MNLKKLISITAALGVTTAAVFSPGCAYGRDVTVTLNGTTLEFSQQPVIANGTTLVPMRTIFETLGMDVSWNGGDSSVTAVKNGKSAVISVGSKSALINGETVELTEAPIIENGTTLVPLRVISEAMGVDVQWDQENYTVVMTDEDKPKDDSWKENTGAADITAMTVSGEGISVDGNTILITAGGDFTVTGTNGNAMIRVNTDSRVKLRLKGVNLTNQSGPAIFFEDCDKGYITISKGTENFLADGAEYSVDAKGTLFSNDDLEIQGGGTLTVVSNYKHAIASDDDIKIEEGTLILTAAGDGIHANDGIDISGGNITITATGDGIQSEDYVDITGGTINITTNGEVAKSGGDFFGRGGMGGGFDMGDMGERGNRGKRTQQPADGQQSGRDQNMPRPEGMQFPEGQQPPEGMGGGQFQPGQRPEGMGGGQPPQGEPGGNTGFGPFEASQPEEDTASSTKGIKAGTNLIIRGGTVTVDSADHALHSADIIYINDGLMNLTSQHGKGISAHGGLCIDGGTLNVLKSTEGLESKNRFCINGGTIHVAASDDGINAGGTNGRDVGTNGHALYINGGMIYVNAAGDGLDANGMMYILGGTVIVNGPTSSGNGALDSGGSIIVKGGTLIASGSSGMAEYPRSSDSTQNSISYNLSQTQTADALLRIEDGDGNEILTYRSSKPYQNLVFSSSLLEEGKEYRILLGGSYEGGTETDGVLTGGSYSGGTLTETFTLQETTTMVGTQQRGMMGGRGGGMW